MIYIDIETLPTQRTDLHDYVTRTLKAPANYKKQESIDAWLEENRDEAHRKTALSGLFGEVLCIGYAINDEPVQVIYQIEEKHTLAAFAEVARTELKDSSHQWNLPLIGHNIRNFDAPFLCQRMIVNGLPPIFRPGELTRYSDKIHDTAELFAFAGRDYYKLESLCLALGVDSPKSEMGGADVYDYYLNGRIKEIMEYCARDVEATRSVYKKITGATK